MRPRIKLHCMGLTPLNLLAITLSSDCPLHQQKLPAVFTGNLRFRHCAAGVSQQHVDIAAMHNCGWPHYLRCLGASRVTCLFKLRARKTYVRCQDLLCGIGNLMEKHRRNASKTDGLLVVFLLPAALSLSNGKHITVHLHKAGDTQRSDRTSSSLFPLCSYRCCPFKRIRDIRLISGRCPTAAEAHRQHAEEEQHRGIKRLPGHVGPSLPTLSLPSCGESAQAATVVWAVCVLLVVTAEPFKVHSSEWRLVFLCV
ncbi:hypothetical protein TRSC58_07075 [Trypanosoma rangeli SC58]|uniref:Secreted protein n=1 Tax=Trypanosoma rangeli SC58 TaxID=429131 RepID=A0A061ISB8_TRYRA|nr:hypothetical protein TRSC58_07075 [Trypanosoma rangeli SC58]